MGILSGSKKTTFTVDMQTQRILGDNTVHDALVRSSISKVKNSDSSTAISLLNSGSSQITNYYNMSKHNSPDTLPSCYIIGTSLPSEAIKTYLMSYHNITNPSDLVITSLDFTLIPEQMWINYYLYHVYNYNISDNLVIIDNLYYIYNNYIPNIYTNTITVSLKGVVSYLQVITKITTITIANIDESTDNATVAISQLVNNYDSSTGVLLNSSTTLLSTVTNVVPKDSIQPSITSEEVGRSTIDVPDSSDTTITIPMSPRDKGYLVTYTINTIKFIFIYYPQYGTDYTITQTEIPSIGMPEENSTQLLNALPVTVLRNNYFSINEYDIDPTKYIPAGDSTLVAERNDSITKSRYDATKRILRSMSINVDDLLNGFDENPDKQYLSDAFLMLGVVPSDTNRIVSKVLYDTIEYLGTKMTLSDNGRTVYFEEFPYNTNFEWNGYSKEITNEVIGKVGTYTHEVIKPQYDFSTDVQSNVVFVDLVKGTTEEKYGPEDRLTSYFYTEYEETYYYRTYYEYENVSNKTEVTEKVVINTKIISRVQVYQSGDTTRETISTYDLENKSNITIKKQITSTQCSVIKLSGFNGVTRIGRTYLAEVSEGTSSDNFIIPLLYDVIKHYSPTDKILLLERSLRIVLYVAKLHVEKLKWYQTGIFQTILQIIAIVVSVCLTYISGGSLTPVTASVVSTFMEGLVYAFGATLALNIINETVKNPLIKTILVTAVAIVSSNFKVGSSAIALLNAPSTYLDSITKNGLELLDKKMNAFQEAYNNKLDEFNDKLDSLNGGISVRELYDIESKNKISELFNNYAFDYYDIAYSSYTDYSTIFNSCFDDTYTFKNELNEGE